MGINQIDDVNWGHNCTCRWFIIDNRNIIGTLNRNSYYENIDTNYSVYDEEDIGKECGAK